MWIRSREAIVEALEPAVTIVMCDSGDNQGSNTSQG